MRLSTLNLYDAGISTLMQRQNQMQDSQERLTSGKKVEKASDDPTGAARVERAMTAIGRADASKRALDASRNSMTLAEGAMGDANEILQQIRETFVAAGNGSYSDSERTSLANKVAGLRNQLLSIANRPDGNGGFLFSGQGASSPPFLDGPNGVRYFGTSGQIQTGNLESYQLTVDGGQAWEQARTGNGSFVTAAGTNANTGNPAGGWIDAGQVINPTALTGNNYTISISGTGSAATYSVVNTTTGAAVANGPYATGKAIQFDGISTAITGPVADGDQFQITPSTSSLRIFDVLDQAVANLSTGSRSPTQVAQANVLAIRDLDSSLNNLQTVRSQLGDQLNNLDNSDNRLSALKLYNQQEQSDAEDLDMTQAISDFQNQQTGYDAALKAYATVQRMSLFQYLSGN